MKFIAYLCNVIELSRHIEILLLRNDCVIVPDFGGFMAHHIDARRDEDGLFVPPMRTIGFNPQLRLNDSLLAQSYAEAYDSSYPEAVRRIESEVNELRQHLENEGSFELSNIGTLKLNEDHHYVFEPCEAGILTPELYGLTTFEMKPLSEQKKEPEKQETIATEAPKEKPKAIEKALYTDDDSDEYIRIPRRWVRNAATAAVALIAVLVLSMPLANSGLMQMATTRISGDDTFKPMASEQKVPAKVETQKAAEKPAEQPKAEPQPAPAETTEAEPEATKTVAEEKPIEKKEEKQLAQPTGYCIVLASQVTRKNAQAFVQQLHREGLLEATVYVKNGVVRVIYKNFETEAEAYNDLNMMRGDVYFDDAWVMKM